jgi:hypothetical protein
VDCAAAVQGYERSEISAYNGHAGASLIKYSKGNAKAYLFRFDLSKGFRIRTWLGEGNTNGTVTAALGTMAENLRASAKVAPIAGINGDYFDMSADTARPTGLVISDSARVYGGWSSGNSTDYCYFAELGDHNLYHGRLDCAAGYPGGDPTQPWQVGALGRKVRNAIRTNYQNYPVKGGVINPVGGGHSSDGYTFSTTIGNYQSRTAYWRTLVGIGTNETGVATNLVLFTSNPGGVISGNFPDVDAYQIMIDEGCSEVGEFDGGGSASMWAQSAEGAAFEGPMTANGGYVMAPRDSSPRKIATGLFVMPPPSKPDAFAVNKVNTYPTLAEARLVATSVTSDTVEELDSERPRRGVCVSGQGIVWEPYIEFGAETQNITNFFRLGSVSIEVKEQVSYLDGAKLRMIVKDSSGKIIATVGRTLSGPGIYQFPLPSSALRKAHEASSYLLLCSFELVDIADDGTNPTVPNLSGAVSIAAGSVWFAADAACAVATGGEWQSHLMGTDSAYRLTPGGKAVFKADSSKGGIVRAEATLVFSGGYDSSILELLLDKYVAEGRQASVVSVKESDELHLYGLVRTGGKVVWTRLYGVEAAAGEQCRIVTEFDYGGEAPRVSYLVAVGGAALSRLRDETGNVWHAAAAPEAKTLSGEVEIGGQALLFSTLGLAAEAPPTHSLDYIQADGQDDYVDLGVSGRDGLKMVAVMEWDGEANSPVFCGSECGSSGGRFWLYARSSKTQRLGYLSEGSTISGSSYPVAKGVKYTITSTLDAGAQKVECVKTDSGDGYGSVTKSFAGPNDTRLPLYLFANNLNGTAGSFAGAKCYSLKLYRKDSSGKYTILVRDLLPVKDPANNGAPAFYDLVSGTYLRNGGTGDFKTGAGEHSLLPRVPGLFLTVR